MNDRLLTAVDANFNRALEGLRVCEDVCRFVLRDGRLAALLKQSRHDLAGLAAIFPQLELLRARDVAADPVKSTDLATETTRNSPADLFTRNLHRAAEALRSIEEFSKLGTGESARFQALRFSLYAIEQDALFSLRRGAAIARFAHSLYAICDPSFAGSDLSAAARALANGGASIIQLRMKNAPAGEVLPVAREISAICRERNAVFIVNDRPDIALAAGAHGVHLGQDDMPVPDVRKILPPDMIIGVSTHSPEQAGRALGDAPDYLAIGPVYDTPSKYGEPLAGIGTDAVRRVAEMSNVPVVAIGGIVPEKAAELAGAGVNCLAVMSFLFRGDIAGRCREVTAAIGATVRE